MGHLWPVCAAFSSGKFFRVVVWPAALCIVWAAMARLETFPPSYQSNAAEVPVMRKWIGCALVLSLILHGALFIWFRATRLERFDTPSERLIPQKFPTKVITISDSALNNGPEPPKPAPAKLPDIKKIDLPKEEPTADAEPRDTRLTPAAPQELPKAILNDEKPQVDASTTPVVAKLAQNASKLFEKELAAMDDTLIKNVPKSSSKALVNLADETRRGTAAGSSDSAEMAAASRRLDALLGGSGVKKGDAPLSLPGGALFRFGEAEVQEAAKQQLRKLGTLIKKSPNVIFSIEGHTDSFGDDETNMRLSEARAESIRKWLVENMDVDPARIQVRGFGKSKLLVQPRPYDERSQASLDAEKARQQPNRRVEIVFRFPGNQ